MHCIITAMWSPRAVPTILLLVCTSFAPLRAQNVEILLSQHAIQYGKLIAIQWVEAPTEAQVEEIRDGLLSERDRIVEEAIKAVVIHRLEETLPILESGVGKSYSFARILGNLTAEVLSVGTRDLEDRLQRASAEFLADKSEDYAPLRESVQSILVTQVSRSLRDSEAARLDIPEEALNEHQRLLLEYSARPQTEAINNIVEALSSAEIAGAYEYSLIAILDTYGGAPINEVISVLSDQETLSGLGPYARLLFVRYLRGARVLNELTEEQRSALLSALSQPDHFDSMPSLQIAADMLRQEVTGVDEEK